MSCDIVKGISGVKVEVVSEERAIKCLQRIELLTVVRREVLIYIYMYMHSDAPYNGHL